MRFDNPLIQLPITFSAERLASEVAALPPAAWIPHPQGFAGNDAVPLVSAGGGLGDGFSGAMAATQHLRCCPYVMDVMRELDGVWGRSRLMGLAAGAEVPPHVDIHYYWRTHIRIHIPVVTNPGVIFTCGDERVHMAPGECWIFDSFQMHDVQNKGSDKRIHLVLDTVGGDRMTELIQSAQAGPAAPVERWNPAPGSAGNGDLKFERVNAPKVMTPWEIRCHVEYLAEHVVPHPALDEAMQRVERFIGAWQAAWTQFGDSDEGLPTYRALLQRTRTELAEKVGNSIVLRNKAPLIFAFNALILGKALGAPMGQGGASDQPPRHATLP